MIKKLSTEARDKLFKDNIRIVYFLVHKMHWRDNGDMIQHGCMGLVRGIETYDESKGPFSPYIYKNTLFGIYEYLSSGNSSMINIPAGINKMHYEFKKKYPTKKMTVKNIMDCLGVSESTAGSIYRASFLRTTDTIFAMDENGREFERECLIGDKDAVFNEVSKNSDMENLAYVCEKKLSKGEYIVAQLIYGLNGRAAINGAAIAKNLGVSRARISQVGQAIARKIKLHSGQVEKVRRFKLGRTK